MSFGTWWGDSLTHPRLDISSHRLARGGEILLLAQGWTSLVVVQRVVGRFSYSPQDGHLSSLFGAWWGDSLTRHHAPNDDEMSSLGRVRKFPHHTPNDNERAWWGDSLTYPRLDIFHRRSSHAERRQDMSSLGRVRESPHHAPKDDDQRCPAWGE